MLRAIISVGVEQASKSKMANIKQMAMKIFQEEREAAQWAAKREQEMVAAAAAALKRAEEEARIRLQEERELARLRAERAMAEEKAREEQEALAAAVQAEVERLRNRTPLEVLQEEMAELRQEFESYKKAHPATLVVPLKQDGTPDMRYNASKILSIVANNGNLGIDPHHGFGKVLQVVYKLGDSETLVKEVEEHQTLEIEGEGLKVLNAIWFTHPKHTRCTSCCAGNSHTHQRRKQADVLAAVLRFVKDE
jgi:uncharacterized protein (DUF2384 family)